MANFRKRGDKWQVRITINGIFKCKTFDTKAKATAWAALTETEIRQGEHTMATFIKRGDSWLAQIRIKGISKNATFKTKAQAQAWAAATETEIRGGLNKYQVKLNMRGVTKQESFETKEQANEWMLRNEAAIKAGLDSYGDFCLTDSQLKRLYNRTKDNSKLNDIGHFISYDNFVDLWEKSDKRCSISGLAFSDHKPEGCRRRPFMPSVDRIDCNGGYNEGNIRFVCVIANIARSDFPDEILYKLAYGIYVNTKSTPLSFKELMMN